MKYLESFGTVGSCRGLGAAFLAFVTVVSASCARQRSEPEPAVVHDLVALLPQALVDAPTSFIDIGSHEGAEHLRRGWSGLWSLDGDESDPVTLVWGIGKRSVVEVKAAGSYPLVMTMRCLPFWYADAPVQRIRIRLNGEALGEVTLQPGLHEYETSLPSDLIASGSNRLDFEYAYSTRPSDVDPASSDLRQLAVAWDYLRFHAPGSASLSPAALRDQTALYLPFGSRVDYYFQFLPGAALSLGPVVLRSDSEARVHVLFQPQGEPERALAQLSSSSKPRTIEIPLARPGIARLSLQARAGEGPRSSEESAGAILDRPAVTMPGTATATEQRVAPRPSVRPCNVLVYLVDTLRADHLGAYGYERPVSANVDAFAAEATLFERAFANAPYTKASVASLFTGLLPVSHGANGSLDQLPSPLLTLAEFLHASGLETMAVVTNGNVSEQFGYDQGFEHFVYLREDYKAREIHQLSPKVNQQFFTWLDARHDDRPFFAYLHATDPHSPYEPPKSFRERFAADVPQDSHSFETLEALTKSRDSVPERQRQDLIRLYDAEIAANDHSFGELISELRRRGLLEETLVVFVSDHGEEFYEHGGWQHASTLFNEQIRVPLIVRFPDGFGRGKRITDPVQLVDLLPTVGEYLGLKLPDNLHGKSLLPLAAGSSSSESRGAGVFSFRVNGDGRRLSEGVVMGDWKLIRQRRKGVALYLDHRETDPEEGVNVAPEHPVITGYLASLLATTEQYVPENATEATIDPELKKALEALGYLE